MWYSLLFLFVVFVGKCSAAPVPNPPDPKKARTDTGPKCIVQTAAFHGVVTPCQGDLQKLSELQGLAAPARQGFGAENLAQLLLFRSGIFDEQINTENFYICPKHHQSLGAKWIENRPTTKRGTERVLRCNMPPLPGLPDLPAHTHAIGITGPKALQADGSVTIWRQQGVFVPLGTGKNRCCFNSVGYFSIDQFSCSHLFSAP